MLQRQEGPNVRRELSPREVDVQQLRAQEAWGKWNTAPLANRIYGKSWLPRPGSWLLDYLILITTYAFYGYLIWSFIKWL